MDGLTEGFGQLSTNAKEWKPASERTAESTTTSATTTAATTATATNPYTAPLSPNPQALPPGSSALLQTPPVRNNNWQLQPLDQQQQQQQPQQQWTPNVTREFVPGQWKQSTSQQQQRQQISQESGLNAQQHQQLAWGPQNTAAGYADAAGFGDTRTENSLDWNQPISIPTGPPPAPALRSLHSMGVSEEMWLYYRDVSLESQQEMDPTDPRHKAVPQNFVSPFPLDNTANNNRSSSFGYPVTAYKVVNREDGLLYCIRRVDNVRSVSHKIAATVTERWNAATTPNGASVLDHPGVVRFYRVFCQNRAVFLLYQYCPGARTLRERMAGVAVPEPIIWSCITQLASAIRAVHGANLACRALQLNHILCTGAPDGTGRIRLRINCLGMVDALEFESRKPLQDLQQEDMRDLGRIIMSLSTGTEVTRTTDPNSIRRCDMFIAQNYSRSLHSLVVQLLLPTSTPPPIFDVCNSIASRAFDELDWQQTSFGITESALQAEYDSGRAMRLLLKMGFVNERPELGMNRRWTESGDCYILKLFRDYVFHQADGMGNPVMDLGHVVTALNKLDAADDEKIVLVSRDGKTLVIVTYADVAQALESAYGELCAKSVMPQSLRRY